MELKIATIENVNSLTKLAVEFRNHLNNSKPTKEDFQKGIAKLIKEKEADFFIAIDQNESIQGYILQRYRFSMWASGTEARIEDLFISPNGRKHGSGKALVNFAIDQAKKEKCTTICLDTNENNQASTRIYTQLGFNSESKNWNNGRQIFFRRSLNQ